MSTFRTLELAIEFNDLVSDLHIVGHMRDQLERAASSIALNLSEGNAKWSVREKKRFYQMAYASQKECQTILRLLRINDEKITSVVDHLGASVYKLMRSDLKHIEPDSRTGALLG